MQKEQELAQPTGERTSADETSSNSNSLVNVEEIPGTPFSMAEHDGTYYLVWGQYVISSGGTRDETLKRLEPPKSWETQAAFTLAIIDKAKKWDATNKSN